MKWMRQCRSLPQAAMVVRGGMKARTISDIERRKTHATIENA